MDDETNKPETDVDNSSTASSNEEEAEKLIQNDQPSEDTAESTEIQGKEIPVNDTSNTSIAVKRTEFDRFHEQFDAVEINTVGEALDYRTNKIKQMMKFKEELSIAFSQNGNIHQSYNASWREEVRQLFRLEANLRRRKNSLTIDEKQKAVTNPADYAFGPHEIQQMFEEKKLPANRRNTERLHQNTQEGTAGDSGKSPFDVKVARKQGSQNTEPKSDKAPKNVAAETEADTSTADLGAKENKEAS